MNAAILVEEGKDLAQAAPRACRCHRAVRPPKRALSRRLAERQGPQSHQNREADDHEDRLPGPDLSDQGTYAGPASILLLSPSRHDHASPRHENPMLYTLGKRLLRGRCSRSANCRGVRTAHPAPTPEQVISPIASNIPSSRRDTPKGDARSHQRCPALRVDQSPDRQTGERIAHRKSEPLQETYLGIVEIEVGLHGLDQQAEDLPVEERKDIGQRQYAHHIPAISC